MSFNRGNKRNAFGQRNFNRSGGGMSGRSNGGSLLGDVMGGSSRGVGGGLNPWESGMMPGRGLLPTPNNNLSLTSPQASLVIASNLLSNLLRNQQDSPPQVPSLLSLGNNLNGPGAGFSGQQNFPRYNDRMMRHPMKNQRPQPYNKMGNRARDAVAGRRGQTAQQSRAPQSANQRNNGNQNQHRNDKTSKANSASKQNQNVKKEQQEVKASDKEKAETHVAKSDESEGGEEKKRDWKDEKKEGENSLMDVTENEDKDKDSQTGDADKTTSPEKKNDDAQTTGKKSSSRHAESRYSAVPMSLMFCHVCNKHMWDGSSFENHLRGRAHQLMMDKLDESYKLKVDLMRHELRVAEEQRELTLTNSKRRGKKVSVDLNVREYCTMCDLNFFGTLSNHRKSEKHQQLKTFLHPRCFPCMKEFPSRIEYDEHCLTPVHMKSAAANEERKSKKKADKLAKGESEVRTAEDEEKDLGADFKTSDKEEEIPEETDFITDIPEDVSIVDYKYPSLKHCRAKQLSVGQSMVKEITGYHCQKCRRFMATEEDMTAHLRSATHYKHFVQEIKALAAAAAAAAKAEVEEEAASSAKVETQEEADDDYEGDWKRRKVENSTNKDASVQDEVEDNKAEESIESKEEIDGDKKYDPMEADEEDEDEGNSKIVKSSTIVPETFTEANTEKMTEKDGPVEEIWAEIDNDNDADIGNLIDDDGEERGEFRLDEDEEEEEETVGEEAADPVKVEDEEKPKEVEKAKVQESEKPKVQEPVKKIQEAVKKAQEPVKKIQEPVKKAQEPEKKVQVGAKKIAEPVKKSQEPEKKVQEPEKKIQEAEKTKEVEKTKEPEKTKMSDSPATVASTPKVEKTALTSSSQVKLSPVVQVNTPPDKATGTPRGRGFPRGRGTPRARRSRR